MRCSTYRARTPRVMVRHVLELLTDEQFAGTVTCTEAGLPLQEFLQGHAHRCQRGRQHRPTNVIPQTAPTAYTGPAVGSTSSCPDLNRLASRRGDRREFGLLRHQRQAEARSPTVPLLTRGRMAPDGGRSSSGYIVAWIVVHRDRRPGPGTLLLGVEPLRRHCHVRRRFIGEIVDHQTQAGAGSPTISTVVEDASDTRTIG